MPKVSIQRFNRKWVTRAPVDWQKYRKRFHAHEKIIILEKSGGGGGGRLLAPPRQVAPPSYPTYMNKYPFLGQENSYS